MFLSYDSLVNSYYTIFYDFVSAVSGVSKNTESILVLVILNYYLNI